MPKISVIVPVYNIQEYLPRLFETILSQSFTDFELLVFNDGSTDNSYDVCKKYEKTDSRIKVFDLKHSGVTETRNTALKHINCEYTVFVDGDDYVEPDYLKNLFEAAETYSADLVISGVIYNTAGSDHVDGTFVKRGFQFIEKKDFKTTLPQLLEDRRLNYLYAKIYRSEFLKSISISNSIKIGEDTLINFNYLKDIKNIAVIDCFDYHYIKYPSRSVTSRFDESSFENHYLINKYIIDIASEQDLLSNELIKVIDGRIFQSAVWTIEKILSQNISEKEHLITNILQSEQYKISYQRQKGNIDSFPFEILPPQSGKQYLNALYKKQKFLKTKANILSACPDFLVDFYHKIKGVKSEE